MKEAAAVAATIWPGDLRLWGIVDFDVIGEISAVETIARGTGVQERASLTSAFGAGLWRKRKGVATVRLPDGTIAAAELHWFEAHGIGRRRMKIKRFFD